jgi:hypothetical protein
MCNKGIKIINMLIFFTWVLPALTAVFYSSVLHAAPCDPARLISFPSTAAGAVFVQKHRAKSTIQTTKGQELILSVKSFHDTSQTACLYLI